MDVIGLMRFFYLLFFKVSLVLTLVVTQMTFGYELEIATMKSYLKKPIGVVTGMTFQYGVLPSVCYPQAFISKYNRHQNVMTLKIK